MYKVGICGHFGLGKELVNGQTDKTMAVYKALAKAMGEEHIALLDTCGWQKNPVKMLNDCRKLLSRCENIIMMPARNGYKVFPAVFTALNSVYSRKLHYVVVGGWLAEKLQENRALIPPIRKLDRVYVELEQMMGDLHNLGIKNVIYMPNFRETNALAPDELVYSDKEPYRLCTFSRIMKNKGIEEAADAVRFVNNKLGRTVYTLDIFGKVEPDYAERFSEICGEFEDYITYRGFVESDKSTQELKSCFAVLFPTVYDGEGFAGTIIDAFSAGVPVIATAWRYNADIIRNLIDGIVYDPSKPELLGKILLEMAENPEKLNQMKLDCLERAEHFEADEASKVLLREIGFIHEREVELK